ncbi:hypothetical protein IG193_01705 [Infirmifilum lucidum]|uniref:Transport permease protein n=1 Tax=Infirmifilum lucidum TaxID=2776706 RepID=A0A7L9FJK7_9CREN|nr:hypothetical protein [Infirmifilum lucidum]QOJ79203.1 hypothetical protein IG193_01705 [Infirmifilum lucidum]
MDLRVFLSQLKAGAYLWASFYRHAPALIAVLLLRPYLVLLALVAIEPRASPASIVRDVLLSVLIVSSVDIIWDLAGNAFSLRFLGILPYLAVSPSTPSLALILSYIPRYIIESLLKALEFAPLLAIFLGLAQALLYTSALFALSALAVIPLLGLSSLVAYSVLASKEETVWLDRLAPLILLVSGAIYPVSLLPPWLRALSRALPTTYLFEMAHAVTEGSFTSGSFLALSAMFLTTSMLFNIIFQFLVSRGEAELIRRGVHV